MPRASRASSQLSDESSGIRSRKDFVRDQSTSSEESTDLESKKFPCVTCGKTFTTSGHLSRHSRIHTGEKKFHCPFPGCETSTSRKDNLNQHYRIHLGPGSRSSRSRKHLLLDTSAPKGRCSVPPLDCPPALEDSRLYVFSELKGEGMSSYSTPSHSPVALGTVAPPSAPATVGDEAYPEMPSPSSSYSEPLSTPDYNNAPSYFPVPCSTTQDSYYHNPRAYLDYPQPSLSYHQAPMVSFLKQEDQPLSPLLLETPKQGLTYVGQQKTFSHSQNWRQNSSLFGALG